MIDKVVELIHKDVDGVASTEEQAQLKKLIESDPETRRLYHEMRSLAEAMAEMKPVEPPRTLKPAVMWAIDELQRRKPAAAPHLSVHSVRTLLFGKPGLIFAGGLAAGLLLFLVTTNLLAPRSVDDSELTGTLVFHGSAPGFVQGQLIDVNSESVKGTVETQFGGGLCLIRVRLEAPEGVSLSILTDPAAVHLEAVRPSDDSGANLSVHGGVLTLDGAKSGGLVALFSGKEAVLPPAHLRLTAAGKAVFEGEISLNKIK